MADTGGAVGRGAESARASVIIATYNRADFIREAIDSALAQTHADVEVIVVDDASTDATAGVLAAYGSRIRHVRQEHAGVCAARNRGFAESTGSFVLFLDSDDAILPRMLERAIERFRARPDFGVVYTGWRYVDREGATLGESAPAREGAVLPALLLRQLALPTPGCAVVRRGCVERVGGFDGANTRGEDFALWLELAKAGVGFGAVAEPLLRYRIHGDSRAHARLTAEDVEARAAVVHRFFALPDLAPEVRALEATANAIVRLENALRAYRMGEPALGRAELARAYDAEPAFFGGEAFLEIVAAAALDPRTTGPPEALIDALVAGAPVGHGRRRLRRRARGRYRCAAAFLAHARGDRVAVRAHALAAILRDPRLVLNRGFVSISLRAAGLLRSAGRASKVAA